MESGSKSDSLSLKLYEACEKGNEGAVRRLARSIVSDMTQDVSASHTRPAAQQQRRLARQIEPGRAARSLSRGRPWRFGGLPRTHTPPHAARHRAPAQADALHACTWQASIDDRFRDGTTALWVACKVHRSASAPLHCLCTIGPTPTLGRCDRQHPNAPTKASY